MHSGARHRTHSHGEICRGRSPGMTQDRGVCRTTVIQRQWMFSTRITCKLIPGRVAAKAYSLGASAPCCALKGHGKCSFPSPLQGGSFFSAPQLGLKPQPVCPPALSGSAAKRRGPSRAYRKLTLTFAPDGQRFFASPSIRHVLTLAAHKIPHDGESDSERAGTSIALHRLLRLTPSRCDRCT